MPKACLRYLDGLKRRLQFLAKANFSLEQIQTCRSFHSIQAAPKAPKPFHIEFKVLQGVPRWAIWFQHGMTGVIVSVVATKTIQNIEHHYSICHVFLIEKVAFK